MKNFLILFLSMSTTTLFAQQGTTPSQEEQQIRDVRRLSNLAIAQHNSLAIANYWTNDFHLISSRNSEVAGREQNRKLFAVEFKTRKDVLYVRTPVKIEINATWNMASETGTWTGQWQESDGVVKLSGTYYAKWHKLEGEWKIRGEIFTPLSCSGSSFCKQNPNLN